MNEAIRNQTRYFVRENFLFDQDAYLEDGASLIETGVVDSTGILELITFLENQFGLEVADEELTADNFDTIDRIVSFVVAKRGNVAVNQF